MAKDALIKLRCSQELKSRLEALATSREQSVSAYIRTRLLETTPELMLAEDQAAYLSKVEKASVRVARRATKRR